MAESTRPQLAGGGMWIGFQLAQQFDSEETKDRFIDELAELCKRYGVRAEKGTLQVGGDTRAGISALIFSS